MGKSKDKKTTVQGIQGSEQATADANTRDAVSTESRPTNLQIEPETSGWLVWEAWLVVKREFGVKQGRLLICYLGSWLVLWPLLLLGGAIGLAWFLKGELSQAAVDRAVTELDSKHTREITDLKNAHAKEIADYKNEIGELKAHAAGGDDMPSYEDAEAIDTSYDELIAVWKQAEEKKNVLEFVNQFRFKRVTWKCKIIEMPRVGETFYICGPDANTPPSSELPPKYRILASFSPNRFSTLVTDKSNPTISGLLSIDPTDKSVAGIRLDECRIIQH